MFGSGKTYYHPVYIDNLIDAFLLVMETETGTGGTYIIADEEYVTIRNLVKRVAKAMDTSVHIISLPFLPLKVASHLCEKICTLIGITPPLFPRRADWYKQVRAFKIDKARHELGYYPAVGLDEGLRRTARWYRQEGYLKKQPSSDNSLSDLKYKSV